jgi:hypothetical protein
MAAWSSARDLDRGRSQQGEDVAVMPSDAVDGIRQQVVATGVVGSAPARDGQYEDTRPFRARARRLP